VAMNLFSAQQEPIRANCQFLQLAKRSLQLA
jgi:hypothetical protein